jgi:hypothetical protein
LARGGFSESQKVGKRGGLERGRGKFERNEGVKSRVRESHVTVWKEVKVRRYQTRNDLTRNALFFQLFRIGPL